MHTGTYANVVVFDLVNSGGDLALTETEDGRGRFHHWCGEIRCGGKTMALFIPSDLKYLRASCDATWMRELVAFLSFVLT